MVGVSYKGNKYLNWSHQGTRIPKVGQKMDRAIDYGRMVYIYTGCSMDAHPNIYLQSVAVAYLIPHYSFPLILALGVWV